MRFGLYYTDLFLLSISGVRLIPLYRFILVVNHFFPWPGFVKELSNYFQRLFCSLFVQCGEKVAWIPHTTWNEFGSYAMYMTWFSNSLICLLHILGKMLRCAIRYGYSCFDWSLGIVSWKFSHFPLCCVWFDWACCPLAGNKKIFWAFLLIGGKTKWSPLCNSQSVFHVNPDCLRTFDCVK